MWSALNNPLYWPENNYARIGDNTQAVTALAQQGNTLIIFKEREIYYSEYVASTLDAEDFVNGSVLDTEVNAAYFPVTPLSADIGCDCPGYHLPVQQPSGMGYITENGVCADQPQSVQRFQRAGDFGQH